MKTGPWKCDTCGQPIKSVEDGYIEWLLPMDEAAKSHPRKAYGLHLVHNRNSPIASKGGCLYRDESIDRRVIVQSLDIDGLMGDDGLMKLLHLVAEQKIPLMDMLVMIQRLRLPNYEQAMPYMDAALREGEVEPNNLPGFYWQGQLESAINWGQKQHAESED